MFDLFRKLLISLELSLMLNIHKIFSTHLDCRQIFFNIFDIPKQKHAICILKKLIQK